MCTDRTMNKHITEAMRIKAEIQMLKAELEAHQDFIKGELEARDKTAYTYGKDLDRITVTWKEYSKKRLDQKKLKEERPEIVAEYMIEAKEKRFTMRH